MASNLDRYKEDLERLIKQGNSLCNSIQHGCLPEEFRQANKGTFSDSEYRAYIATLPDFRINYQTWYSESLILIKKLLPDRLIDFKKQYESPDLNSEGLKTNFNYSIEDYLMGITVESTLYDVTTVTADPYAAVPRFQQQLRILKAAQRRFESSLFDIRQLLQMDLFDSELDAAREMQKKGFLRCAGVIAGVVLEKHLGEVCNNHNIKITKKKPTIGDYNEKLYANNVYDLPTQRQIQHLADIRNLCGHSKEREPTSEEIDDIIRGVERITKNVF